MVTSWVSLFHNCIFYRRPFLRDLHWVYGSFYITWFFSDLINRDIGSANEHTFSLDLICFSHELDPSLSISLSHQMYSSVSSSIKTWFSHICVGPFTELMSTVDSHWEVSSFRQSGQVKWPLHHHNCACMLDESWLCVFLVKQRHANVNVGPMVIPQ